MRAHRYHPQWIGKHTLRSDGHSTHASLVLDPMWAQEPTSLEDTWGDQVEQLLAGLRVLREKGVQKGEIPVLPGFWKHRARKPRPQEQARVQERLREAGFVPVAPEEHCYNGPRQFRGLVLGIRRVSVSWGRWPTFEEFAACVGISADVLEEKLQPIGGSDGLYHEAFSDWRGGD